MTNILRLNGSLTEQEVKDLEPVLSSIQGNILRGHGRRRSVHIFFRFDPNRDIQEIKKWISSFALNITSAQQQLLESQPFRDYEIPGKLFCSFFLSAKGYQHLGLKLPGNDLSFCKGMGQRNKIKYLNDPPLDDWQPGYRKKIHAMLLLADNNEDYLDYIMQQYMKSIRRFAEEQPFVEYGAWNNDRRTEPFGYVDGKSQPLFFEKDEDKENQKNWRPGLAPHYVLVKEPHGCSSAYGSYLVFRKLEQNVDNFNDRIHDLAKELNEGTEEERIKRAYALVMGRYQNGEPLIGSNPANDNDFNFQADPAGGICPLHAHIRTMNSRQEGGAGRPRIARRGIPYKDADNKVGLLFMCYQASIVRQFEPLQVKWANAQKALDPIIGQSKKHLFKKQQWPTKLGEPPQDHISFGFEGFVTPQGGEYFFAPSLRYLVNLPNL